VPAFYTERFQRHRDWPPILLKRNQLGKSDCFEDRYSGRRPQLVPERTFSGNVGVLVAKTNGKTVSTAILHSTNSQRPMSALGQKRTCTSENATSAIPPSGHMRRSKYPLFDHLVSAHWERSGDCKSERPRCRKINRHTAISNFVGASPAFPQD
jgi:hypothetical protein